MTDTRDFDVVVAGGGPAGIAAALAASACGASVLLVESYDRLGGNVAQAFVHTICGLFHPSPAHDAAFAHDGIARAFTEALRTRGDAGAVEWAGAAGFVPIDPDGFCALAESLCRAAPRITLATGSRVTRVASPARADDPFTLAVDGSAARSVRAWTLVDTTGDANAATLAGATTEVEAPGTLQHPSYIFRIDGVDPAAFDAMEGARTSASVARHARRAELPDVCSSVVVRRSVKAGSVFVTMNLAKPDSARFDPLDPAIVREMSARAEQGAHALVRLLAAERDAFRAAREGALPSRIGIRETRRVRGLVRLEVDSVLEGSRTADEACVSTWPVELWSSHERMEFRHVAAASSIPIGCLVADHPSRRLAMAGRCASASHQAHGAIRVIATSMAMGEAAGVACALAAEKRANLGAIDAAAVRAVVASGRTVAGLA